MEEKILLVEDDKNQQYLYQQELLDEGYKVVTASNSQDAIQILKSDNVDLVILDICLPGKDGIETLSEIMELNKKLPVIINSAYGTYKDNFMTWSADAYVVKSSDLSELKTTIRALLDKKNVEA